jgi:hypothetical protein
MATERGIGKLREYIAGKLLEEQGPLRTTAGSREANQTRRPNGSLIDGPTMAKVDKIISAVPDPVKRQVIRAQFGTFTKHQAVDMVISPASKMYLAHPELMVQIADVATEDEYTLGKARSL